MTIKPITIIRPLISEIGRPRVVPIVMNWLCSRPSITQSNAPHFAINVNVSPRIISQFIENHHREINLNGINPAIKTKKVPSITHLMYQKNDQRIAQSQITNSHFYKEDVNSKIFINSASTKPEIFENNPPTAKPMDLVVRRSTQNNSTGERLAHKNNQENTIQSQKDWNETVQATNQSVTNEPLELSPPLIGKLTDEVVRNIDRRMRSHRERLGRI